MSGSTYIAFQIFFFSFVRLAVHHSFNFHFRLKAGRFVNHSMSYSAQAAVPTPMDHEGPTAKDCALLYSSAALTAILCTILLNIYAAFAALRNKRCYFCIA